MFLLNELIFSTSRTFLLYSQNSAVIADIFDRKSSRKALTDYLVFSLKYRGKVLEREVAEAAEAIIWETCKELDIEVIDLAVNVDHV